jgi:serine/threonine protein kinase/Tfp pilus assembly protein PilF
MTDSATREWHEALALFGELVEADEAAREMQLDRLRQSAPAVAARVVELLAADRAARASQFLERPALAGIELQDAALALHVGDRCGAYVIEERIGTGGMGEVWRARRADGLFESSVAIKTLHPHLASRGVRERFVREGRLLGRLSHPHIARLLDAGITDAGALYLVLEFVAGERIDTWCDQHRLGVEQRVRLFVDVCAAVAHAHASLVVHRDLKPSNVLVTSDGSIKLLDFGIAKLVEGGAQSPAQTELTRLWGNVLTPEYAAPEQLLGEAVTTATDVHALGVMLYRLLTGRLPYGEGGTAPQGATQARDTPTLLEGLAASGPTEAAEAAAVRATTATGLRRELRGDLTAIVGQAMRKLPADRYPSVLSLSDDLQRYLEHRPVAARPESRAYRAGRYVRRHRVAVAAAAITFVALVAGMAGAAWQAERARDEARRANAVRDFLLDIFQQNSVRHPDGAAARAATAETLLAIGAERIGSQLQEHPAAKAEILGTVASLYRDLSLPDRAIELYTQQIDVLGQLAGDRATEVTRAMIGVGMAHAEAGRYDEARRWLDDGLARADMKSTAITRDVATAHAWLGQIAYRTLPPEDPTAEQQFRKALALLETAHPDDINRVQAMFGLARVQEYRGELDTAEATLREAVKLAESSPIVSPNNIGGGHQLLGDLLRRQRRFDDARQHLERAVREFERGLGPDHPYTADARRELGKLMGLVGFPREAVVELESALASLEKVRGADDPELVAGARVELGHVEFARGRLDEARRLYERSIAAWRAQSADSAFLLNTLGRYARLLEAQGDLGGADAALREFRQGVLTTRGKDHAWYAHSLVTEGNLLLARGQAGPAAATFTSVLAQWSPKAGEMTPHWLAASAGLVRARIRAGDVTAALQAARAMQAHVATVSAAGSLQPEEEAQARLRLGQALWAAGERAAAGPELRRAVELRQRLDVDESPWLAEANAALKGCNCPA